jgi:hypothetical protein
VLFENCADSGGRVPDSIMGDFDVDANVWIDKVAVLLGGDEGPDITARGVCDKMRKLSRVSDDIEMTGEVGDCCSICYDHAPIMQDSSPVVK